MDVLDGVWATSWAPDSAGNGSATDQSVPLTPSDVAEACVIAQKDILDADAEIDDESLTLFFYGGTWGSWRRQSVCGDGSERGRS